MSHSSSNRSIMDSSEITIAMDYRAMEKVDSCSSFRGDDYEDIPSVVPINVGGHRFMTRRSTLCKYEDSMLAAMFSGRHIIDKDRSGYYFIDSNGTYFSYILEFLRHDTLPPDNIAYHVYKDACYYNITRLVEKLSCSPAVTRILVREAHRTQFPDYYELREKIIKIAMENAAVDKIGEVVINANRKEFTPRAQYFNTNHECVADTAHVIIGPWESPADEETLIKCLEHDFISSGFNIKPHEQRKRCRYYNGQNCQKSIWKITFNFQ